MARTAAPKTITKTAVKAKVAVKAKAVKSVRAPAKAIATKAAPKIGRPLGSKNKPKV